MSAPFTSPAAAAWAILDRARAGEATLTRKAAGFVGETAVDTSTPLSPKQANWLASILERAGLPPLANGKASHDG